MRLHGRLVLGLLCAALAGTACNEASFSGSGKKQEKAKPERLAAEANPKDPNDPNDPNGPGKDGEDPNDPDHIAEDDSTQKDVEVRDGEICYKKILPVNIAIALDTTGSMQAQINTVRNNLAAFVDQVKSIKPAGAKDALKDVKVGIVTYKDAIDKVYELTGDMSGLRSRIQGLTASGGDDAPEAGFIGALRAMKMLNDATKATESKSAINILFVISDTYSHAGGSSGARNYEPASVKKALALSTFKNFLLYSSVPDFGSGGLGGLGGGLGGGILGPGGSPADQWEKLRDHWASLHPDVKSKIGRNLGFPFQTGTLIDTLPSAIKASVKLCK